jgi:hypothetical protein
MSERSAQGAYICVGHVVEGVYRFIQAASTRLYRSRL